MLKKLSQMTFGQARIHGYTRSNWLRAQHIAATYKAKPHLHITKHAKYIEYAKKLKPQKRYVAKVYARVNTSSDKGGKLNINAHYFKVFNSRQEAEDASEQMRDDLEHAINKVFNHTGIENTGIEIEETTQAAGWCDIQGTYNRGVDQPSRLFISGNKDIVYIDERKGEKTFNGLKDWLTWKKTK